MDALFLDDVAALRAWVAERPADATEVWLGFARVRYGAPVADLTVDAAAEVLAETGWVESGRGPVDATRYAVRFAPGKVTPRREAPDWAWDGGQAPPPELAAPYAATFQENAEAWAWFESQPPRYRRVAIWWVMGGKAEATRDRRLRQLVEASANGERVSALQRQM